MRRSRAVGISVTPGSPSVSLQITMGPMANEIPNGAQTADGAPSMSALIQYTKDFSFENPKAPHALSQQGEQGPQMSLQVNVSSTALTQDDYETVLRLEGKAEVNGETMFAFDLSYGGVFRLQNIPEEHIHPVLVIDCARLLFPFARQIIAEAVQNGGFPPFYVPPIDFAQLFQQRLQELQGQQGTATN
jgi:preprotein translocase subunit SecB